MEKVRLFINICVVRNIFVSTLFFSKPSGKQHIFIIFYIENNNINKWWKNKNSLFP